MKPLREGTLAGAARTREGALRLDVLRDGRHVRSTMIDWGTLSSILTCPTATDWPTVASLATAAGTLVLAIATFAAVRSSNRSARLAELALEERRRPVLVQSRLDDPLQKIMFVDGHWVGVAGSRAVAESLDGIVYLVMSLRNVGAGIGVLQGWVARAGLQTSDVDHIAEQEFRRQTRDLYIRRAMSASGRARCATQPTTPAPQLPAPPRHARRSRSTCSTAIRSAPSARSAASTWCPSARTRG
jgi:hypothetical protein